MDIFTVAVHDKQRFRGLHERFNCEGDESEAQVHWLRNPRQKTVLILIQSSVPSGINYKERSDYKRSFLKN